MPPRNIESEQEFDSYLQNADGLVVNFTAEWCGPCKAIAPSVDQLYESFTNIDIIRVDGDKFKPILARFQISAFPTFIFFQKSTETNRVRGANLQAITEGIVELSQAVGSTGKRYNGGSQTGVDTYQSSDEYSQISKYIPSGFSILNSSIFFGEYETLNTEVVDSKSNIKDLVTKTPESTETSIVSDADSQILLHIPLANVSKVYSILIKVNKNLKFDGESTQIPNKVKIWNNNTSIISFEHATTASSLHDEEIDESKYDSNGWYEIKLKYVRFQKVSSLDIFIDGDDEDEHTSVERVLIVGIDGESKNQGKLEKIGDM